MNDIIFRSVKINVKADSYFIVKIDSDEILLNFIIRPTVIQFIDVTVKQIGHAFNEVKIINNDIDWSHNVILLIAKKSMLKVDT